MWTSTVTLTMKEVAVYLIFIWLFSMIFFFF